MFREREGGSGGTAIEPDERGRVEEECKGSLRNKGGPEKLEFLPQTSRRVHSVAMYWNTSLPSSPSSLTFRTICSIIGMPSSTDLKSSSE